MKFKPERFLGVDGREAEYDPRNIAFGFGRRYATRKLMMKREQK